MAVLPLKYLPDPILRKKARPVAKIDNSVARLIKDMLDTMREAGGVGLAANQVGKLLRIAVIEIPEESPLVLVNPEVTRRVGRREIDEGCLSVPGYSGLVNRSIKTKVKALDAEGVPFRISAEGLLSQALEHEIDHLDGVLFIDHLVEPGVLIPISDQADFPEEKED